MYELYLVVSGLADEILDQYLRKINCTLGKTREISVSLVCHRGVAPWRSTFPQYEIYFAQLLK